MSPKERIQRRQFFASLAVGMYTMLIVFLGASVFAPFTHDTAQEAIIKNCYRDGQSLSTCSPMDEYLIAVDVRSQHDNTVTIAALWLGSTVTFASLLILSIRDRNKFADQEADVPLWHPDVI